MAAHALAACALACALVPATAHAATKAKAPSTATLDTSSAPHRAGSVSAGAMTITLSSSAASALKRAHVTLAATGDASLHGRSARLPIDSASRLDPTTFQGVLLHDGSLAFHGKSRATVSAITLKRTGATTTLTAKVGKHVVSLGTLKGGKTSFKQPAAAALAGGTLVLSKAGASAINKAAGSKGVRAGSLGSVAITTDSKELPIASGTASLTLDPSFVSMLSASGVSISGIAPATLSGGVVTLPISGGAFDPFGKTGRIWFDGGVNLSGPKLQLLMGTFTVDASVPSDQTISSVLSTGVGAVFGQLDLSGLSVALTGTSFSASNAKVALTAIGAGIIKQSFGVPASTGTLFGTTSLAGQLATGS